MDFDDLVKIFIPKSKRKALKKRLKKEGLFGVIKSLILTILKIFSPESRSPKVPTRSTTTHIPQHPNQQEPLLDDLAQANVYLMNIRGMAETAAEGSLERIRLEQLSDRVTEWVTKLETIVTRVLEQRDDALLAAELKQVPKAIKRLEQQLAETTDAEVRKKLERTLENRRKQLIQLKQATNQRKIVELKVENTLAQLGIIYAQLHSGEYLRNRGRYERMAADIAGEVEGLDNYLIALNALQQERVP